MATRNGPVTGPAVCAVVGIGPMTEIVLPGHLHARVLTTAQDTEGQFDLVDTAMPPGAATPLHLHTRYEERLWVLEGALLVHCGSERVELTAGDFYRIPRNTPHMVRSVDGARALAISSPAAFAELLMRGGVPVSGGMPDGVFDPELFGRISAELGDQVLGPPGTESRNAAVPVERAEGGHR
jgi:mannose-6-phosphate isomerase-like protein (cupin superfamily)